VNETRRRGIERRAQSEEADATAETIHGDLANISAENDRTALFQTVDGANENRWLRRSVIRK